MRDQCLYSARNGKSIDDQRRPEGGGEAGAGGRGVTVEDERRDRWVAKGRCRGEPLGL